MLCTYIYHVGHVNRLLYGVWFAAWGVELRLTVFWQHQLLVLLRLKEEITRCLHRNIVVCNTSCFVIYHVCIVITMHYHFRLIP